MPTTVNGIGTHYYGKRNRSVRRGQCRSCGHVGDLASYDTRLWFVVIFIPIIPLGRKRIIDDCPSCRRHYAAKADEFAIASQLTVSEGKDRYQSEPTVDNALDAHARMLGYHQHDESDAFRKELLERFPHDAGLRAGLANHLDQVGRYDIAATLYAEAHELEPELPEACVGVAFARMNEGKLEEARRLLSHLEAPGAGQVYSLGPLETLATLYQQRNQHEKALELFRHLLNEYPDAAQLHGVRKMVQVSEKKLKARESILPGREESWLGIFNPWSRGYSSGQKWGAFLGLVGVLFAAGMALYNDQIRRNRTLHIVSGLTKPVTVQVDNGAPFEVAKQATVTLPEGTHQVSVSGPVQAAYDVTMAAPYWSRWGSKPVWVVNVAGTAGLIEMQYHYARNPTPPSWTHLIGQTFVARPHIDYPFVDPPDSLPVKKRDGIVTRTGIIVVDAEPQQLLQHISAPDDALAFLETHLPMRPEDALLFHDYEERLTTLKKQDRGEAFLKPGLDRKPIEVNWHRTYQNLLEAQGRLDDLRADYDRRLEAAPNDAMLLYLRSRFEGEAKVRREFMTKALAADPENPWPHFGIGFQAAIEGDWRAALTELQIANAKGLDQDLSRRMMTLARLGNGEADKIVEESKAVLAKTPMDIAALFSLIDTYVSTGRLAEAQQELDAWKAQRQAILPTIAPIVEMLRLHILYGAGNFMEFQQAPPPGNDPVVQRYHAAFYLANGQPVKVAADPLIAPKDDMPWDAVALSVSYHLAHDDVESERWLAKACERFKNRGAEERMAAAMLTTLDPPDFETVRDLSLEPSQKLLFLCAVAQQFPALAPQAGELAAKLNVTSLPPCQLVRSVFPASKGATTEAGEKTGTENEARKESGT